MADPADNSDLVRSTLLRCREAGVKTYCVCAGSRNSPLVVALSRASGIKVYSFFEERSAAFFAIGCMQASDRPVAVVTTSGTAVAELLPAAVESYYQALPLILITADRPAQFRGSGAPQAIEQIGIFGRYAESDPQVWEQDRPLHLNVEFGEPLSPEAVGHLDLSPIDARNNTGDVHRAVEVSSFLTKDTAVILGKLKPDQTPGVLAFLESTGLAVLAEANSNLRGHPSLAAQEIRGTPRLSEVGRVLRLGGIPSCRLWRDLEGDPEIPVCSVSEVPFSGLARPSEFIHGCPSRVRGQLSGTAIIPASRRPESWINQFPRSEPALVQALSRVVGAGSLVFLGNSMPIRTWDLAAVRSAPDLRIVTNRGANGIDGNISSFLGASAGCDESWCLVGDLTALYDLAAPWILSQLPGPSKRRIVVINNRGGAIFRRVKDLQHLESRELDLMTNPHHVGLEAWAAMWGMEYLKWNGSRNLPELADVGNLVIEVFPDQDETEAFWRVYQSANDKKGGT